MSETRQLIEETAQRIFKDLCTPETVNAAEQGVWPAELWRALEESGLTVAAIAEDHGGAGGTLGDTLAVLRWSGRFAAPVPLVETFLGAWMLSSAGMRIPNGALAVSSAPAHSATLRLVEGGWLLSGEVPDVTWPHEAGEVVVLVPDGGGHRVCLVSPETAQQSRRETIAGEPAATLTFEDALIAPGKTATTPHGVTSDAVAALGALCRAVQMAGALESILTMTIEHANVRVQFGRPIGGFQAVRQQIAVLATQVAAANRAAQVAIAAAERGDGLREIAVAKARVGEAATLGAEIAHQVHGAMGITYEHTLHHFTRRIWTWREDFGSERNWQSRLGRAALADGADQLWPFITSI